MLALHDTIFRVAKWANANRHEVLHMHEFQQVFVPCIHMNIVYFADTNVNPIIQVKLGVTKVVVASATDAHICICFTGRKYEEATYVPSAPQPPQGLFLMDVLCSSCPPKPNVDRKLMFVCPLPKESGVFE